MKNRDINLVRNSNTLVGEKIGFHRKLNSDSRGEGPTDVVFAKILV